MENSYFAVVRKSDGRIRALFDHKPAAEKWCGDWNNMAPQNPYFVFEMNGAYVAAAFNPPPAPEPGREIGDHRD